MRQHFRVTMNGGVPVGAGTLATCAMFAMPYVITGKTVYIRNGDDNTVVVEVKQTGASATRYGSPIPMPDWADNLLKFLNINPEVPNE